VLQTTEEKMIWNVMFLFESLGKKACVSEREKDLRDGYSASIYQP
jgi:hypothetical protein